MIPPDPILTPADVPGGHADNDPAVAAMIAAATRTIDGPSGWVGRSFGPQTLELTTSCWADVETLPYGPVIDVDSITYIASDGSEQLLPDTGWILDGDCIYFTSSPMPALATRRYPIKIQYQAGYDGEDPFEGGTGDVPEEAKAAIVASVQQLMLAQSTSLGVRSVEVNDIETVQFLDADKVSGIIKNATACYLSGLWVPVL
jgi:hypothetical protein